MEFRESEDSLLSLQMAASSPYRLIIESSPHPILAIIWD
jgi:hypothetical protein